MKNKKIRYGIPYKGSKSRLVDWILPILPKGIPLRDVIGGGGAISLACLHSGFYSKIHYNELDIDIYNLFSDLCLGKLNVSEAKKHFVTREEFIRIKNKEHKTSYDNMMLLCYSFGNNMSGYMYGKDIEKWKYLLHTLHFDKLSSQVELDTHLDKMTQSRIFKLKDGTQYRIYMKRDYDDYIKTDYVRTKLRYKIVDRITLDGKTLGDDFDTETHHLQSLESLERLQRLQRLESLERLQRLESLESLESLERLQNLERHNKDYRELDIPEGDVIYCDPPYENTDGYKVGVFDSDEFRERAEKKSKTNPIFISSYQGRPGRDEIITTKGSIISARKRHETGKKEKIFYKTFCF